MLVPKALQSSSRPGATRISNALALSKSLFRRERGSVAGSPARSKTGYLPLWNPSGGGVSQRPVHGLNAASQSVSQPATVDQHFQRAAIDPLYLIACHIEWERRAEPSAAWEIVSAAQSLQEDTRAHARALLACSHQVKIDAPVQAPISAVRRRRYTTVEANVKAPYGLEIIDSCTDCNCRQAGFFCSFSVPVLKCLEQASHHTTLPAGAILFVEGQIPRGIFMLCSGRVKLSTASREGKVLILKFAEAGEAMGLSAVISGMNYEMTAETATPCQLNYVDRKSLMNLIETHSEVGMHAAQALSREFQFAYRDMHDLVLARSATGKLARLLLSSCRPPSCLESFSEQEEMAVRSGMTHEEMAQRIGASRETVTRLLSDLKKRQLIRLDGATLVIRDRMALEALVV